MNFKLHSTCN